jgi:hypothetical protein
VAIGLSFAASQPHTFPLDDAYIHLAYGKSLAFSGTLGLNPGEPSLGTSSPLWALVLVPLFWLFRDPYWSVHAVSLLSAAGYTVIGTRLLHDALGQLALSVTERRAITALGALLLAANGSLVWMSLSGMETCLVLFLCTATIATYTRFGPGARTGVLLGLCLLGRSTSLALVVALVVVELVEARRYRQMLVTIVVAGLVCSPYAFYSWSISGSAFPNTAKGKLLTYVSGSLDMEEWLHFWGRVLAFHKYLLAYPLLGVSLAVAAWRLWRASRGRMMEGRISWNRALAPIAILGIWALVHVAEYTFAFRTIGQQGRYLAEWLLAVALVGSFAVGYCVSAIPWRPLRLLVPALVGAAHLATLPYWVSVYRNNIAHVESTYVQLSRYIRETTPKDSRIASFDIGTIRYVGDRYTIDLGGLVDSSTHKCLKERSCGDYVYEHGATHIMYPKDPESDKLTGVQQAVFGPKRVLREVFVKQVAMSDYAAPTLTHSFRLQLFRIDGWFDRSRPDETARAFREEPPNAEMPLIPTIFNPDGDLVILGYRTDVSEVRYIREYPYTFTLWLAYRALQPLRGPKWLHVLLFDDETHRIVSAFGDLATAGVLLPSTWPVGQVVEEHRVVDIPYDMPHPNYHIYVSITDEQLVDFRYPELYPWLDLGLLHVQRSKTTALSPL